MPTTSMLSLHRSNYYRSRSQNQITEVGAPAGKLWRVGDACRHAHRFPARICALRWRTNRSTCSRSRRSPPRRASRSVGSSVLARYSGTLYHCGRLHLLMCTAATLTVWTAHCTPWPTKLAPINSGGRCAAADPYSRAQRCAPAVLARPLAMRTHWPVRVSAEARADVGDSAQRCALHISAMRRDCGRAKSAPFCAAPKGQALVRVEACDICAQRSCLYMRTQPASRRLCYAHCSTPLRSALCPLLGFARLGFVACISRAERT